MADIGLRIICRVSCSHKSVGEHESLLDMIELETKVLD
jgi:hypothetical protein